jgi:hypothetical protein
VIGYCQGLIAQLDCPLHQIFGMRGTVEKREIGVAMKLGVTRIHIRDYIERVFEMISGFDPPASIWVLSPAVDRPRQDWLQMG